VNWTGAILSAGCLKIDNRSLSTVDVVAAHLLSYIFPKFRLPDSGFPFLCKSNLVVSRYMRDPLISRSGMTTRLASQILSFTNKAQELAQNITNPILILHGESDGVTSPAGSKEFYDNCASEDKELHMIPHIYHEILNEDCRNEILKTVLTWLDLKVSGVNKQ